jgi:branched-chain amino acid aminotransferase
MRVYVNGQITAPEDARISALDHGFLFGDSVFEVLRTYGRRPFRVAEHLTRLERSAAGLGLELPARERLLEAIFRTCSEVSGPELYIRLIVTRGVGRGPGVDPLDFGDPGIVVIGDVLMEIDPALYERGCEVALVGARRSARAGLDPALKTGNSLNSLLALMQARAAGALEGILLNADGELTEAARSNLFLVRESIVSTPPLHAGLLGGITRDEVLRLCHEEQIPAVEQTLYPADLQKADEAFLTSTTKGLMPVTRVGGHPVGQGAPGPVTRRLRAAFQRVIEEFIRSPDTPLDRKLTPRGEWLDARRV